jgi:hypothetical protein
MVTKTSFLTTLNSLIIYGANYSVAATCVQNHMKLRKNPKFIPSWQNAPFDGLERPPKGIEFRLKIEGGFSLTHPKFAHG